jgi:type II secretory pathway component GspD/PulD (secretin)
MAVKFTGKMLGKAVLALALVVPTSAPGAELELYRPKHRSAQELAPLIDPLLGAEGGAVPDAGTGSLLLSGSAEGLARAQALLSQLDVPLARYRVESRIESREALRLRGYTHEGEFQLGSLRIARLREPDHTQRREPGALRQYRTRGDERTWQSLLVAEGSSAELWTGSTIPFRARNFEFRDREERVLEIEPLLAVRTGLELRPRSLPEGGVELEMAAVAARGGTGVDISRTSSSTRLRVRLGEWLALDELSNTRTFSGSAPVEPRTNVESESDELLLFRVLRAPEE